jgi:hypothetical protein
VDSYFGRAQNQSFIFVRLIGQTFERLIFYVRSDPIRSATVGWACNSVT